MSQHIADSRIVFIGVRIKGVFTKREIRLTARLIKHVNLSAAGEQTIKVEQRLQSDVEFQSG